MLERRVGIALFARDRTGARLTPAGRHFLEEAALGAGYLQQAVNSIALAKRGELGRLRIGLMASLSSGFLADLFAGYHRKFPAIEVSFEETTSQVNASSVLNGRLDAAFMPGDPRLPGCRTERLWDEQIYVAVPLSRQVYDSGSITLSDLRHETFLVTADAAGPEIEDYLVRHLSEPGFRPRVFIQNVGRENLLNMVARGFGITLTTGSTLGISYGGIGFYPIAGSEVTVSSSIIWSVANQNPALRLLIDMSLERAGRGQIAHINVPAGSS